MKRMVEIIWEDVESLGGWKHKGVIDDFLAKTLLSYSVGYVYQETETLIAICQSKMEGEDTWGETMRFPKIYIKEIRELRARSKRR